MYSVLARTFLYELLYFLLHQPVDVKVVVKTLSVREVNGSITALVKSDTVSPTLQ